MTQKYQVKVSMKQAAIVETGIVLKQGDFGMQLEIEVLDFDATGTTPQIVFRKAMGAVESTTITVSSNKYTYTFKGTELDTPGKVFCDLKLKNSTTQRISTASFMFKVVADTLDGLAEESSSYSDTIEQIVGGFNDEITDLYGTGKVASQRVEWRNGSVGNLGNPNGIAFVDVQSNNSAHSITILVDKKLSSGHKYRYQYTSYSVTTGRTQDSGSYRITIDKTIISNKNFITIPIDDGAVGFAFALYELDANDAYIPLRIESFDTGNIYLIREYNEYKEYCDEKVDTEVSKVYSAIEIEKDGLSKSNFDLAPNILDLTKLHDGAYISGSNGTIVEGTSGTGLNCCIDDYMEVLPSTTYFVYPNTVYANAVFYNSNKEYISGSPISGAAFTTTNVTKFVRMSFKKSTLTAYSSVSRVSAPNRYIAAMDGIKNKAPYIDTNSIVLGTKGANAPYEIQASTTRCTTGFVWIENTRIKHVTNNKLAIYLYQEDLTFDTYYGFADLSANNYIDITEGRYCIFVMALSDESEISPSDYATLVNTVHFEKITWPLLDYIKRTGAAASQRVEWRNGSVMNLNNQNGISFVEIQSLDYADSITVLIDKALASGHKYRYQLTTFSVDSGLPGDHSGDRITIDYTIVRDENYYTFRISDGSIGFSIAVYEYDENGDWVPLRVESFDANNIYLFRNYDKIDVADDYCIGADFIKKSVTLKSIGQLEAIQAFCKYNNNYYSTDGSNLYVQDSSFNLIDSVTLDLGHGNALQLGSNGKAYASGWDDDKVYVVDLATKTITDTISLPVSGYTTCAVDDVNGLIYIFHRDTPTNTKTNYNFVVYDYINDEVISTKKTTRSFGAMQSCDFVDGKIFVLYGLGTESIPNGYTVYNTSGDIIAEYILKTFTQQEPEGVFIDRDNFDLYISFLSKTVYRVENV